MSEDRPTATQATPPACAAGRSPVRLRLADLMTWVLGAGIAAAVCREAKPAAWFAPTLDVERILGLVAAILAILLWIALFRQAVARERPRGAPGGAAYLIAVAWRLAVLGLLGGALVVEARLLGGDAVSVALSDPQTVRSRLLPLAVTFALAGILAGLAPFSDPGQERPRRLAWLSVVWAAVAGLVIATTQTVILYLILLAMNAVRNAMTGRVASQPLGQDLHGRILRAGAESTPVLACCLVLGLLIARELRGPASRPGEAGASGRVLCALLATTAAAGVGAAWLLAVTLPRLDDWLAEGLRVVIDPLNAAIIVLGFAGLALGPAARATDPPERPQPDESVYRPRTFYWRALGKLAFALFLLDFIAGRAIDLIVARRVIAGGPVDQSWTRWVGWVDAAFDWLRSVVPFQPLVRWNLFEGPEWLALALAEAWVAWRVASLLVTAIGNTPTPIDASLADRRTFCRFAIRWAALTVLMVASLPASFLVGLALLHILIRGSG